MRFLAPPTPSPLRLGLRRRVGNKGNIPVPGDDFSLARGADAIDPGAAGEECGDEATDETVIVSRVQN